MEPFLDEIGNSKTFEANLQNSGGRPVESYWTSSPVESSGHPIEILQDVL